MTKQLVDIGLVKPNPDNPRIIKDDKFKKLVQSLKDFPVMTEKREILLDENNMILGGNMRHKAAKAAGWKQITAEYFTREDAERNNKLAKAENPDFIEKTYEEYCQELVIKDNVSGGEWDWDALANQYELADLDAWGVDFPEALTTEENVVEDEAPEVSSEPAVSELGKVYQLGRHRIMCGDATKDIPTLMAGDKADMVFTDPPYGMLLDTNYSGMHKSSEFGKGGKDYDQVIGDNDDFTPELITTILDNYEYCKEIFMWGADYYRDYILPGGSWIVWDKRGGDTGMNLDKLLGSSFELCWSLTSHKRDIARILWSGHHGMQQDDTKSRVHPTQKPANLAIWFFNRWGKEAKIVADPYLGSGSTLIACEQTGRICYGMELDPKYVDVIRKRYAKFNNGDQIPNNWEELTPAISDEKQTEG